MNPEAIKNKLVKIFNCVFFCTFFYLMILAIGNMNLQAPLSALLLIPCLYFLYKFVPTALKRIFDVGKTWYVLQIISCIVMVIMVFSLRVSVSWDWGRLLITAHNYIITGEIDRPEYFMIYPNNRIWLVCLIGLFKIISLITASTEFSVYKAASMALGICLTQISIHFIYKTAKLIWDEKKAFCAGVSALLYIPFYLYAMFLYTDTPGICLATLIMYYSTKLCHAKTSKIQNLYAAILGLLGGIVLHIKVITFIAFIAAVIYFIFHNIHIRTELCIIFLCLMGSYLLLGTADHILEFDENVAVQYELPYTHWIMMALNTSGGFKNDDVIYSESFDTYEKKKAANIEQIKNRISNYGFIGTTKHILYTKQLRTWANSCLAGDDYVSRKPILESSLCQRIFSKNGDYHWVGLIYSWLGHITIMLGMLLSAVLSIKEKLATQRLLQGRIAIFGLFMFLSIWECNSRYLLTLTPIMILVAADGWFMAYETLMKIQHRTK